MKEVVTHAVSRFVLVVAVLVGSGCEPGADEPTKKSSASEPAREPEKHAGDPPSTGGASASLAISPAGEANPLDLPPDVSALLRREMVQLDQGMRRLHSALIMGRGKIAASEARQIHEGFILKQNLTAEQRNQLLGSVPEGFVAQDRAFHSKAAELAKTVQAGEWSRALELYAAMTRACVDCHGTHASARFPRLSGD